MGTHDHLVNQCAFSPDGQWLVSASSDCSARVWSVPSMRLHAVLGDHADDVDMAEFSPDARWIATCALDRKVRIYDRQGRCHHTLSGHTGNVLALAWSRDSGQLVSSSVDGTIRTWDALQGREADCISLGVRTDSVAMDCTGRIYAGDDDGRLSMLVGGQLHTQSAHAAGVKKVAIDEAQGLLVSLSYDRTLALWKLPEADAAPVLIELMRSTLPAPIWARAATIMPEARVACGTFGGRYAVFDPATRDWDVTGVAVGRAINAVCMRGGELVSVGDAGTVRVDGRPQSELGSLCNFLVTGPEGRLYAGGQLGRLFDVSSGAVIHEHHSPLNCAAVVARAGVPYLVIGTYTGELLWVAAGERPAVIETTPVYSNAVKGICEYGGTLFSVCANRDIAWHDVASGRELARVQGAHEKIVNACCALGPGRYATVGRDRILRIWDGVASEVHASPHAHSIKCMAVDDQARTILTGSYGGTLALFDVAMRRWMQFLRPTQAGISSITWDTTRQVYHAASYDGQTFVVTP